MHYDEDLMLPGGDLDPSRRRFLQAVGFGVASATLSGCSRGPATRVIPYAEGPEYLVSGRPYRIATTCHGCPSACGVLARCRDGRPIKLEGNPEHALSKGGLCSVGQGDLLGLYDSKRLAHPRVGGQDTDWEAFDADLRSRLSSAGSVRLLTGTVHGPSTRHAIDRLLASGQDVGHVTYDALSISALLDAQEELYGVRALPAYRFDRARWIVSFEADFLGTWVSPVAFSADYAAGREPDRGRMSKHVQFEARVSLTGAAADQRIRIAPRGLAARLAGLCRSLEVELGVSPRLGGEGDGTDAELAAELAAHPGESLVVCGVNDLDAQRLAAYANHLLGNLGTTLSIARPSLQRQGSDRDLASLVDDLEAGTVDLLIVSDVNPAFDLPPRVADAMGKAGTRVVHALGEDETVALATHVAPALHGLESWGDAEPQVGRYSWTQPTVPALTGGRTLRCLLSCMLGDEREDAELLRECWEQELHPSVGGDSGFQDFFDRGLHDGYFEASGVGAQEPSFRADSLLAPQPMEEGDGLELVLYPKVGLLAGAHAHNPWLQELPDPVTKITWDNYACVSPGRAEALGVEEGQVARITSGEIAVELPVHVQPGQHDDVVAAALGYGRVGTDRFAAVDPEWWEGTPTVGAGGVIGTNVAPLLELDGGVLRPRRDALEVKPLVRRMELACTQDHHSLTVPPHLAPAGGEVRDAVRTASLAAYVADPVHALPHGHDAGDVDLWTHDHEPKTHHWGMTIDMARCTGCSACMIGCQAENNVPVVGRAEVRRHREMHWMRVDRYFEGEGDELTAAFQPMLCQQCDNAPCESVCPVLATVHSSEGLNQQVYNRCVGTRYCANTCPYKARRFNWFDYPREDELQNHSLNPDVTIRTRGVMEKCTFCTQRIQEAKSEAAREGRPLGDGDVQVACQQSCPTQAIVFGDLLDPESRVSKLGARPRAYGVLEELNVEPSVRYLARIRNSEIKEQSHDEHEGG